MNHTAKKIFGENQWADELLDQLDQLPTLPAIGVQINELMNDPSSSAKDIADLLRQDPALTSKLLRLVNSSYYSIPGGVTDVRRALTFLGFNTVSQLILGLSVFSAFEEKSPDLFSFSSFWKHSVGSAVAAEVIAKRLSYPKPSDVFACGLLHDLGKLVLSEFSSDAFSAQLKDCRESGISLIEKESESEFPSHAHVGAMVARHWGLPNLIELSLRYHHEEAPAGLTDLEKKACLSVRLGNLLCHRKKMGASGSVYSDEMLEELLNQGASFSEKLTGEWAEVEREYEEELEKAGVLLSVHS
jgi:putative nucleotidyltransferase with HDIG domain